MMAPPAPAEARVAIVLVNWNGWRECIECIDSLLAQAHRNFHLFIVDNESHDHSIEQIDAWCVCPQADPRWRRHPGVHRHTDGESPTSIRTRVVSRPDHALPPAGEDCSVTLIHSGGNLGFAGGCNVGIRAAGFDNFDFFWLLNPDTVVERRALVELVQRAAAEPRMGIVGSTLRFYDAPDTVHALGGARLNRLNASSSHIGEGLSLRETPPQRTAVERELAYVCGASMLVSTAFVREIGFMQEDYFLYYEEADWAMRAADRFRLGFAPHSHVFHKSGANSSKIMPLFTAGFYYRNRLRFVSRFLPDRMAAAKRKLFAEMLRHLARGRWGLARVVARTLLAGPPESTDSVCKRGR
jgi:GT2 family glycosyltransferase